MSTGYQDFLRISFYLIEIGSAQEAAPASCGKRNYEASLLILDHPADSLTPVHVGSTPVVGNASAVTVPAISGNFNKKTPP